MRKKLACFLLAVVTALGFYACSGVEDQSAQGNGESSTSAAYVSTEILLNTDTRVVISVSEKRGTFTLLECMESTELDFEIVDGMLVEVNGVKNKADYSACWMLYTSDAEMSNSAWGTIEIDGKTLGSAVLGVEALEITVGKLYVLEYQNFS